MAQLTNPKITVSNTYVNTSVNVIQITEDKLVNILTVHIGRLRKSREWIAALTFSISILMVLLTSTFVKKWGLSGEQWQMLFILLFIGSVVYLCYAIYNSLRHNVTVETIVTDIKSSEN